MKNRRLGNSRLLNLFFFDLLLFGVRRKNFLPDFRDDSQYHDGRRMIPQLQISPVKLIHLLSQF